MARETKTRGNADLRPESDRKPPPCDDDGESDGNSIPILIMDNFSNDSSPLKRVMSCVTLTFLSSADSSFSDFTSLTISLLNDFDSFLLPSSL